MISRSSPDLSNPPADDVGVLIVDDYEDNRTLYAEYFRDEGLRVREAANGAEALEAIHAEKPHAVIMDLTMPVMDGWEATRRIKSDPRTSNVLVIVVTGHNAPEELLRASAAGADEVCIRPCDPKKLLALIHSGLPHTH